MDRRTLESWLDTGRTRCGRRRRCQLFQLLSRPSLGKAEAARLRQLASTRDWQPLGTVRLHREVLPLFRSNIESAGLVWEDFFEDEAPDLFKCAQDHYARQRLLKKLVRTLEQAGVSRVVAIKGMAVANLYPSPATRLMCDLDLLVESNEAKKSETALHAAGWNSSRQLAGVYIDQDTGQRLDLQHPKSCLARRMFEQALPEAGVLHRPRGEDLLLATAVHSANHLGERIWRDVADARSIVITGVDSDYLHRGLELARRDGTAAAVQAFSEFLELIGVAGNPLSGEVPGEDEWLVNLYRMTAIEQAHPAALHLLRRVFRPVREHLRGIRWGRTHEIRDGDEARVVELLGELSGVERVTAALTVLAHLWKTGRLGRYRRLIRLQKRADQLPGVFESGITLIPCKALPRSRD